MGFTLTPAKYIEDMSEAVNSWYRVEWLLALIEEIGQENITKQDIKDYFYKNIHKGNESANQ
jgi:hypothetical protein